MQPRVVNWDEVVTNAADENCGWKPSYQEERSLELEDIFRTAVADAIDKQELDKELGALGEEVNRAFGNYQRRREIEARVADYIEAASTSCDPTNHFGLLTKRNGNPGIVDKLRECRRSGNLYANTDGSGLVFCYENKCGQCKLCADEAREESRRLCQRYIPTIRAISENDRSSRIYYAVFTIPNVPEGELREAKRDVFTRFNEWQKGPYGKLVRGSLVVQEDPLSRHGDWNIHLNVILITKGRLDYKKVRETWGYNVDLHLLPSETGPLIRAFLELMKYQVKTVSEKSLEKMEEGKSQAPALVDWPHRCFIEWWAANKGFRRVRSYGVLYRVKAIEKEDCDIKRDLQRGKLRVVGRFKFEDGTLELDSILDDNFLPNNEARDHMSRGGGDTTQYQRRRE